MNSKYMYSLSCVDMGVSGVATRSHYDESQYDEMGKNSQIRRIEWAVLPVDVCAACIKQLNRILTNVQIT
jgi:hypothetical protein